MLLTVPMGPLEANCYILSRGEGCDAAVIDPSDAGTAMQALLKFRLRPTHILLTHGHFDHIAGAGELKSLRGCAVLIHSLDAKCLSDPDECRAAWMGGELVPSEPTRLVADGETVSAAGYTFSVLHTPGHTPGGVCYVCEEQKLAFTGDTVFLEGVGRTDLPGGNMRELMRSVCDRVLALPKDFTLYPGHGDPTTVAHEREHNPLLPYRRNPWFNS